MPLGTAAIIGISYLAASAGLWGLVGIVDMAQYHKTSWWTSKKQPYLTHLSRRFSRNKKERRGYVGEFETSKHLAKIPGYKKILHDVYLPTHDGTTEVDMIMIHETGIYVIENKNYGGMVGVLNKATDKLSEVNATSDHWHSVAGKNSVTFYNPIKQNDNHVTVANKILAKHVKTSDDFVSCVVFNDDTIVLGLPGEFRLKNDIHLCNTTQLSGTIISDINTRSKIFSHEQIDEIFADLDVYAHASKQTQEEHKARVNAINRSNNEKKQRLYAQTFTPLDSSIRIANVQRNKRAYNKSDNVLGNSHDTKNISR